MRDRIRAALILGGLCAAVVVPERVAAQALPSLGGGADSTVVADTVQVEGVTPGGAFLRSVLVPGWGHAAIDSHLRGAFYAGAQGGIGWMLFRIHSRLNSADARVALIESDVRARLELDGITDPQEQEEALEADEDVARARGLVESRRQQREDWIALGIFFALLGGADAFVSAHLKDFPAEPVFEASDDGRVGVGMRFTFDGALPGG